MAASIIPKPGSKNGPCITACQHRDCAASRRQAAQICKFCQGPIGYDTPWYDHQEHGPCHADCLEKELEYQGTTKWPKGAGT